MKTSVFLKSLVAVTLWFALASCDKSETPDPLTGKWSVRQELISNSDMPFSLRWRQPRPASIVNNVEFIFDGHNKGRYRFAPDGWENFPYTDFGYSVDSKNKSITVNITQAPQEELFNEELGVGVIPMVAAGDVEVLYYRLEGGSLTLSQPVSGWIIPGHSIILSK